MAQIVTAMPWMYSDGIHDSSSGEQVIARSPSPDYCPITYLFTERGPIADEKVSTFVENSGHRDNIFGAKSFDEVEEYATHQTVLSNTLLRNANAHFITRLWPADGGPKATLQLNLHLDVREEPVYKRNTDGSYQRDPLGAPIVDDSKPPIQVAVGLWTVDTVEADANKINKLGRATIGNVSPLGPTAKVYPILEKEATWYGEYGNNQGIQIYTNTVNTLESLNMDMVKEVRAFPYRMGLVERENKYTTPKRKQTISGEFALDFCFKPNAYYKRLNKELHLENCYGKAWGSESTTENHPIYGPFGKLVVYQENIDFVLETIYNLEKAVSPDFTDINFLGDPKSEKYMINLFCAHTTTGAPLETFRLADITLDPKAVDFTSGNFVFAQGASNGTMDLTTHEALAVKEMSRFKDNQEEITWNLARYPIMDVVDTGYGLAGKDAVIGCLSHRQQLIVHLCLHTVGLPPLSASEESSLGLYLYTKARNYPESTFHNTETCRAVIYARSGRFLDSTYRKDLPLLFEQVGHNASVCGASSGIWDITKINDIYPGNRLKFFDSLNVDNIPPRQQEVNWNLGIIYPLDYDLNSRQMGPQQTVFPDDTSVLNNYWVVRSMTALYMIGYRLHAKYRGNTKLTRLQLADYIEKDFDAEVIETRKFGDLVITDRQCVFTAEDIKRGYSWTLVIRVGGKTLKTVQTLALSSHRYEDLQAILSNKN